MEKLGLDGVRVDADYQLTVEDAAAVADHDIVIFADAAVDGDGPFYFRRIEPRRAGGFSSHSVEPAEVLGLARELFGAATEGYVLGIRGYEFNEFDERLSPAAGANLGKALKFMTSALITRDFTEMMAPATVVAS